MKIQASVLLLTVLACGDFKVDDSTTLPTAPPPGSTANNGSVAANISGEQFFGRLSEAASFVESRLTFSAYDGYTRQLTISVNAPGPGTYETGGPYLPVVTLTETSSDLTREWKSSSASGFGSITFTFLTEHAAIGHFGFNLFPDSATIAGGTSTRRSVTAGTFNVNVSR